jgi:hypothetical protein
MKITRNPQTFDEAIYQINTAIQSLDFSLELMSHGVAEVKVADGFPTVHQGSSGDYVKGVKAGIAQGKSVLKHIFAELNMKPEEPMNINVTYFEE